MQSVDLARFIARGRTFPLKENNQVKLMQSLSKKARRVPVLRGEKRNPREMWEDDPSFCEW
jgi:hypothetical protein